MHEHWTSQYTVPLFSSTLNLFTYGKLWSYFYLKFYHAASHKALVNQQKEILEAFNNTNYSSDKVSSKHYGRLCNPKLISGWLWILADWTQGSQSSKQANYRQNSNEENTNSQWWQGWQGPWYLILINDSVFTMHQTPDYRLAENTESNMPMRS